MLSRFYKRNMIMEKDPDTPVQNEIYPKTLSAEYFQSVQSNSFFNHLGHNTKIKEAYGVVEITLEQHTSGYIIDSNTNVEADSRSVFDREVRAGSANFTVDLTDSDNKYEGASSFTDNSISLQTSPVIRSRITSYTVQLCIQEYIGIDFNEPTQPDPLINPIPKQPLINPTYPSAFNIDDRYINLEANRHTPDTRDSYITLASVDKTATSFVISVSRSNVWVEVYVPGQVVSSFNESNLLLVPICDYGHTGDDEFTNPTPVYSPSEDRERLPVNTPVQQIPNFIPRFDTTDVVVKPRNSITIAWLAKGF